MVHFSGHHHTKQKLRQITSHHIHFVPTADGTGPKAKMMKKGEFKSKKRELTEEELKKNRQQRKKDLKNSRQEAERKDMFQIICQAKQVWGNLRRYIHSVFIYFEYAVV